MGYQVARVAILLATFNGEKFIGQQLESLFEQDHSDVDVWMSDDGSTDNTVPIAKSFAEKWPKGRFEISNRPKSIDRKPDHRFDLNLVGSNGNFFSLIKNTEIIADYYAFCDQDDIWEKDKLSRATKWLKEQDPNKPAMYCSRTRIIDGAGKVTGLSIEFPKSPSFKNAIIQNISAGNTIVMNQAAMDALRSTMKEGKFVAHDWWAYIVVTALGGSVYYDKDATTRYRQHGSNLIGENASWRARMTRLRFVFQGRFLAWNDTNLEGLENMRSYMSVDDWQIVEDFKDLRKASVWKRFTALHKTGIHRQTFLGQLSLYAGCLFGKI